MASPGEGTDRASFAQGKREISQISGGEARIDSWRKEERCHRATADQKRNRLHIFKKKKASSSSRGKEEDGRPIAQRKEERNTLQRGNGEVSVGGEGRLLGKTIPKERAVAEEGEEGKDRNPKREKPSRITKEGEALDFLRKEEGEKPSSPSPNKKKSKSRRVNSMTSGEKKRPLPWQSSLREDERRERSRVCLLHQQESEQEKK